MAPQRLRSKPVVLPHFEGWEHFTETRADVERAFTSAGRTAFVVPAAAARALPGSGLGFAIVKQTVDDHGGSVTVANADGGGALLTRRFDADGR